MYVHVYMYIQFCTSAVMYISEICFYVKCTHSGLEEEYQACVRKREEKENILNDARAELEALIVDVECHTDSLSQLAREEENAKDITFSHPDTVDHLKEKLKCVLNIFAPSTNCDKPVSEEDKPTSQDMPTLEDKPRDKPTSDKPSYEEDAMDTTQ